MNFILPVIWQTQEYNVTKKCHLLVSNDRSHQAEFPLLLVTENKDNCCAFSASIPNKWNRYNVSTTQRAGYTCVTAVSSGPERTYIYLFNKVVGPQYTPQPKTGLISAIFHTFHLNCCLDSDLTCQCKSGIISLKSVETQHFGKVRIRPCLGVIPSLVPKANRYITFRAWHSVVNTGLKDRYFMSLSDMYTALSKAKCWSNWLQNTFQQQLPSSF